MELHNGPIPLRFFLRFRINGARGLSQSIVQTDTVEKALEWNLREIKSPD